MPHVHRAPYDALLAERSAGLRHGLERSRGVPGAGGVSVRFLRLAEPSASERQLSDRHLAAEVEAIWECSDRTYGAPRVHRWPRKHWLFLAAVIDLLLRASDRLVGGRPHAHQPGRSRPQHGVGPPGRHCRRGRVPQQPRSNTPPPSTVKRPGSPRVSAIRAVVAPSDRRAIRVAVCSSAS